MTSGDQRGGRTGAYVLLICLVFLCTGLWMVLFWPVTIDDAFITFRFANNANHGHGLVWNVGQNPVEGMTSFLWTVILIPFASDKHGVYLWAKILGILADLAAVYVILQTIRSVFGNRALRWGAFFLILCPLLAFHSLNGLETGLAILLTAAMLSSSIKVVSVATEDNSAYTRWAVIFGLSWLAGGMTRPELVLYGFLLSLLAFLTISPGRRRARLAGALLLSFVIPGAVYFVLRWQYFGHLFPLPFYSKSSHGLISARGTGYVALSYLGALGGLGALGLMGYFFRGSEKHTRSILGMCLWPALILCISYIFFEPFMGFVYRFTTPFIVPLVVAASGSISMIRKEAALRRTRLLASFFVAVAAAQLLSAAIPAFHWAHINSEATRECHERVGETLASVSKTGSLLAVADIGGPAFFSGWEARESLGLVTPEVSIDGMGTGQLITAFKPDVIVVSNCQNVRDISTYAAGYSIVKKVPWIVYSGGGPKSYQCVLARDDYPHFEELQDKFKTVGAREFTLPWYFRAYTWLKKVSRQ
jgi:arabinofuranosyltransferase